MADYKMRYVYNFLFYLILPLIFLRLVWKARRLPAYKKRWLERLGFLRINPLKESIWLHAASLGEINAAIPLIKNLKTHYPNTAIIVTTMTPTGSQRVKEIFADQVFHVYVPYDYSGAVKRFLNYANPRLLIIMEKELWPNILHYCRKRKISVLLANAIVSKHSFNGYKKVKKITRQMLKNISVIAAQTQLDAQRFIDLGADPKQIEVTGSIKFDITLPENLSAKAKQLRASLGMDRAIWVAGSTHAGEEDKILQAHKKIKQVLPKSLLILVPRHPERFAQTTELAKKQNFSVISRAKQDICTSETDIIIGDTMGELLLFYAASDAAFVGGSLMPDIGGHNLLEPAALNIPVITGAYLDNFLEISQLLETAGALIKINNEEQLADSIIKLFQNPLLRKQQSAAGAKVVAQNCGALEKLMAKIQILS
jgi:3-deoxy-D-manno-octulosonic-acid transferase